MPSELRALSRLAAESREPKELLGLVKRTYGELDNSSERRRILLDVIRNPASDWRTMLAVLGGAHLLLRPDGMTVVKEVVRTSDDEIVKAAGVERGGSLFGKEAFANALRGE